VDAAPQLESRPEEQGAGASIAIVPPEWSLTIDRGLVICDVDPAGAATFELDSPAQAIGRSVLDFIASEVGRSEAEAVGDLVFDGKVRHLQVVATTLTGQTRTLQMLVSRLGEDSRGRTSVTFDVRDITRQINLENERASLASIVYASQDAIIGSTLDSRISSWNPAAERLFGFTAQEARGQDIFGLVLPQDQERVRAAVADVLKIGRPSNLRIHSVRKDGSAFDSWINLFATRDSAGKPNGFGGIGRDISDLVKLESQRDLLASIVNSSEDAIIGFSTECLITSWNPGAERIFGYTANEALGRGFDLIVPPEGLAALAQILRKVIGTGQAVMSEQRGRSKAGGWHADLVNIFPIRDCDGRIVGGAGVGRDISRLKEIEKQLREAQDYTRGLIESSIDAMVVVDRELRITDINEQFARLAETPKAALIGSRFDACFTEPERAAAAITTTLADGFIANCDLVLQAASAKEVLVSFNASIFYSVGAASGIFGVARDVTEQRAIERTLRREREYTRSVVQSSPDALLVSDSNVILTDVNARAVELTGFTREELIGIRLTALFTDPEQAAGIVQQSLEKGFVREVELYLLTRNAQQIPVSVNASAYNASDGAARGVLIGVRDVTERRRYERERSLLASIVDSSGDAIYSETVDLTITSWNPAAERLYGYSADEIIGRNVALLVPLDRRAELAEHVDQLRQTGKSQRYETRRMRKDGTGVELVNTESPITGSDGKLMALSVTTHDITAAKRTEEELTRARDAALEAARLKSEFLANMSHEIRTPLNSIIGMTGLLLDTELNPEQREFASDVRESGESLLNLINEILDFSKLSAGRLAFEELDFQLTSMVESVIELVAEPARRKGLELTVSIDPEAPQFLRGDPGRLRQVLLNLLSNAIKFTAHGEVAIQVNKLSENQNQTVLRFDVRDTGIGIPTEKQHLLFQPFSQVDASTTRQYGGTGLGLSIARALVEQMGGTIAVSSTPGVGSTFWFTATLAQQVDTTRPASERFASLAGVRVLIVDDNANSLEILRRQVSAWGMEAYTADCAERALEALRKASLAQFYQVAIIDVMMPGIDGIELARVIKGDPPLAKIAIIFVSSVGSRHEFGARLRGLEVGGWLMKPIPQSSLYDALVKLLSRADGGDEDRRPDGTDRALARPSHLAEALNLPGNRKLRALVAEDNPINLKLARLQLKKLGIDTDAVSNGLEAVNAVMQVPYDVVLMDCQMPEMDGYEAAREIRRREGSEHHTPIVAMTAHALAGDREKCLAAGMDGYVSKPVAVEVLDKVLARLIAAKSSQASIRHDAGLAPPPADGAESATVDESGPAGSAESLHDISGMHLVDTRPRAAVSVDAQPDVAAVVDVKAIAELRSEGENLLVELIDLFLNEAPPIVRQIGAALSSKDPAVVSFQAHRLRGSAVTFGATRVCDLCQALEQAGKAGDLTQAQGLFDQLQPACNFVCDALAAERDNSSPSIA
jgi:two-component system, sensor histidine kinase and response regulator